MKSTGRPGPRQGFSLIEILVVVAIMGIMAAITIPSIAGMFNRGENARARRNAQSIVTTFNAARAAGNQNSYSKTTAIDAVTTAAGINGNGTLSSSTFASPMAAEEKQAAALIIIGVSTADTTSLLVMMN